MFNCPACSEKSACSIASANSSIGGNSTATLGNELPSLTISDDFPADLIPEFEMTSIYGKAKINKHFKKYFFFSFYFLNKINFFLLRMELII